MIYDLSKTSIISMEIGEKCNLSSLHDKCPINNREYKKMINHFTVDNAIKIIQESKSLNFTGCFAFHYYNEPLLYKDKIIEIISRCFDEKYLLWTNGTLLSEIIEENRFLDLFYKVNITCYDASRIELYGKLCKYYQNIHIINHDFDNRLSIYEEENKNIISCKRPLYELPIDYYGNIHLCCNDWNNTIDIGNVFENSLKDIILKNTYQNLLSNAYKRLLDIEKCPDICQKCSIPMLKYTKYYSVK